MANTLYDLLGGSTTQVPFSNLQYMMNQFQQFKEAFQGDPKEEVERLLQSGRISQQQLNQLQELATQFSRMLR